MKVEDGVAYLGIAIIMVLSTVCAVIPCKADGSIGTILYVGGTGPGNYTTIQSAIDAASEGNTVFVYNGTYAENIHIPLPIHLLGENRDSTVIDGGNRGTVMCITADFVTVSGLTISHSQDWQSGIQISDSENITISHCIVTHNFDGITLDNVRGAVIRDTIIQYTTYNGLYLHPATWTTILNNTFQGNNVTGIWVSRAVRQVPSENLTLTRNTFVQNGVGIEIAGARYSTYTNNTFIQNKNPILASSATYSIFSQNTFTANLDEGIYLSSSRYNTIINNSITQGDNDGIELDSSSLNTLTGNSITSNGGNGLSLYKSYKNMICGNSVTHNEKDGITLYDLSYQNTIIENTISHNTHCGIRLRDNSYNGTINTNTLLGNAYGILINSSNNNTIYNNILHNDINALDDSLTTWNVSKTCGDNIIGGLYLGGNYWDNYTGADTNGDGIGDIPYDIPGDCNQDKYPLMNLSLQYDVELSCSGTNKTVPPRGNTTYELVVTNTGDITDTITLSLPPPCKCGWMESLNIYSVELLPNHNTTVVLTISTIWDLPVYPWYWRTQVTATSQGDPTRVDTLTVNTTIVNRTLVSIDPSSQTVTGGESFTINITVSPSQAIAGVQFDLSFDPTLLTCTSVTEGDLFQGHSTYFMEGTIDNSRGEIVGVAGTALQGNTSRNGTFAIITFTPKNHSGTSPLNLTGTDVGTPGGDAVPLEIYNGSVIVLGEPWDVNHDGQTNILDLIIIGQHWKETGPPCWIPMDVNCDGIINVLDAIIVGQHWTG